ncbi:MAG: hypothetical protein IT438_12970 [Phycisphaerales bacterium]|nr:hypothetical protein [Phycisphaerales bacterium]
MAGLVGLVCASGAVAQTDSCGGAGVVTVPALISGTTVGATPDGSDSCVTTCATGPDVWVRFVSPIDQSIVASTCGGATWDTVLSLHTGCPGDGTNQVACNDDNCGQRSTVRANITAGTMYYLRIAGWCGGSGAYSVSLAYQPTVPPPNEGPDVIVGDITNAGRYTPEGAITAYAYGSTSCNIGTEDVNWDQDTPGHPLIAQTMFRLKGGRFEQLGQSWLKHTFGTVDNGICGTCNGHLGQVLGVGCSDPYVASQAGDRNLLGPKWEVNATTGVFPYPFASPPWNGTIARRLQVLTSDIDPAQNAGAQYFVEVQYLTADDAQAGNGLNNASYRALTISGIGATPVLTGAVFRTQPAIDAWKAADPSVTQVNADYTEDGIFARFIVAAKVTDAGGDNWDYEYAVRNLNSHRSGRAFSLAIPTGATTTNIGFRDVAYHSGDGSGSVNFDETDWAPTLAGGRLTWSTQTFDANANANALRWGTMYNFRFRTSVPPTTGAATLALFRPGAAGDPGEVTIAGLPVPTVPGCPADFNNSGPPPTVQDIFDFLAAYFALDLAADFNGVGGLSVQDIFDFLSAYFTGCS